MFATGPEGPEQHASVNVASQVRDGLPITLVYSPVYLC